jgi:hypothetical protein
MASHAVHPSAAFVRSSLGSHEDIPVILAGPSNADLAEAGLGAVISLTKATAALLRYEPPSHGIVSQESSADLVKEALRIGAVGYVAKTNAAHA